MKGITRQQKDVVKMPRSTAARYVVTRYEVVAVSCAVAGGCQMHHVEKLAPLLLVAAWTMELLVAWQSHGQITVTARRYQFCSDTMEAHDGHARRVN